ELELLAGRDRAVVLDPPVTDAELRVVARPEERDQQVGHRRGRPGELGQLDLHPGRPGDGLRDRTLVRPERAADRGSHGRSGQRRVGARPRYGDRFGGQLDGGDPGGAVVALVAQQHRVSAEDPQDLVDVAVQLRDPVRHERAGVAVHALDVHPQDHVGRVVPLVRGADDAVAAGHHDVGPTPAGRDNERGQVLDLAPPAVQAVPVGEHCTHPNRPSAAVIRCARATSSATRSAAGTANSLLIVTPPRVRSSAASAAIARATPDMSPPPVTGRAAGATTETGVVPAGTSCWPMAMAVLFKIAMDRAERLTGMNASGPCIRSPMIRGWRAGTISARAADIVRIPPRAIRAGSVYAPAARGTAYAPAARGTGPPTCTVRTVIVCVDDVLVCARRLASVTAESLQLIVCMDSVGCSARDFASTTALSSQLSVCSDSDGCEAACFAAGTLSVTVIVWTLDVGLAALDLAVATAESSTVNVT